MKRLIQVIASASLKLLSQKKKQIEENERLRSLGYNVTMVFSHGNWVTRVDWTCENGNHIFYIGRNTQQLKGKVNERPQI